MGVSALDMADLIASRPLEDWVRLLEPLDCCVSPVLTAAEAAQHPLFNPDAEAETNAEADEQARDGANEVPDTGEAKRPR
jgi:crotonobetainyl-CoA:carnitine CoA-transferase CaiB-like acyl-CoA transferase